MELTRLDSTVSVRPQILPDEVPAIAEAGFKGIINVRPDGEGPDQPRSEAIEAQARRHGLSYAHIPVVPGEASQADARAFAKAVEQAGGPVVAFCKSGGRAASLYRMAQQASQDAGELS